jgi:hypothetical protein
MIDALIFYRYIASAYRDHRIYLFSGGSTYRYLSVLNTWKTLQVELAGLCRHGGQDVL